MKQRKGVLKTIAVSFDISGILLIIAALVYKLYNKNDPAFDHELTGDLTTIGITILAVGSILRMIADNRAKRSLEKEKQD